MCQVLLPVFQGLQFALGALPYAKKYIQCLSSSILPRVPHAKNFPWYANASIFPQWPLCQDFLLVCQGLHFAMGALPNAKNSI